MSDFRNWLIARWRRIMLRTFGRCPGWAHYRNTTLECQRWAGHGGDHLAVRLYGLGRRSRVSWP